jgi:hypothetical protein
MEKLNRTEFPSFSFRDGEKVGPVEPESVLLHNNAPADSGIDNDANGLAYQHTKDSAIQHGISELAERHLFAQVWWGHRKLRHLGSDKYEADPVEEIKVDYYTLNESDPPPFVLATASNLDRNLWVCGSSLDKKFSNAKRHAREESCMILHNYFESNYDLPFQHDPDKRDRLRSIQSDISHDRAAYIKSLISGDETANNKVWSVEDVLDWTFGDTVVRVVPLWEDEYQHVVRILCGEAWDIRETRKEAGEDSPPDVFL